jgi:DNA modification methylase
LTAGIALDAFLGSGTTVIAAERTGRRCSAMELDPA